MFSLQYELHSSPISLSNFAFSFGTWVLNVACFGMLERCFWSKLLMAWHRFLWWFQELTWHFFEKWNATLQLLQVLKLDLKFNSILVQLHTCRNVTIIANHWLPPTNDDLPQLIRLLIFTVYSFSTFPSTLLWKQCWHCLMFCSIQLLYQYLFGA